MKKGLFPWFLLPSVPIGPALIFLVVVILLAMGIPMLAITVSPELMLLFQIAASIVILNWVRNTIGPGTLSLAISAILIYIFVFLLPQFTVGLYVLYFLLVLGILDIVIWMSMLFPMKPIGQ
ncbi:MAG: hypothetical protein J7K68_00265 [Candidatus Diapherotrites archaeon]|nr:hypothetical protein [Candidatus Diapherotrites archaeon]